MLRPRRNLEAALAEAEARFGRVLQRHALKWTDERRAILRAIADAPGHFSADDLVTQLHRSGISASRATVFRALPLLVEAGLVQPMMLTGEVRRYETALGRPHHDHMVCTECGEVIEFEFEAFEMLQRELAARHGFTLTGHVHELYGLCARCSKPQDALPH